MANQPGAASHTQKPRPKPLEHFPTLLEQQYPQILLSIQTMWGYKELNTYFHKLTVDERGGREGFKAEVWEEIATLWRIHQEIVPESRF